MERLAHNRAFAVAPNRIRDLQQRFDETTLRLYQSVQRFVSNVRHREHMASAGLNKVDLHRFILHKKDVWGHCHRGLIAGLRACLKRERARFELAAGKMVVETPGSAATRAFAEQIGPFLKTKEDAEGVDDKTPAKDGDTAGTVV